MRRLYLSLAAVLVMSTLFMGCSKDDDKNESANSILLSGVFGEVSGQQGAQRASALGEDIKNAIAIPIASDRIMMEEAVPLDIKEDGSFTAAVTEEYGWVVLLENANGEYKFLSLPLSADSNETLITFFPKSDLDFGTVEYKSVTDEADSENNVSEMADKFIFTMDQLTDISAADDVFKAVANSYRNNYKKDMSEQVSDIMHVVSVATDGLNTDSFVKADTYTGFMMDFEFGSQTQLASAGEKICANDLKVGLKFPSDSDKLYTSTKEYTGSLMSSDMEFDTAFDPSVNACTEPTHDFVISYGPGSVGFFRGEDRSMLAQNTTLPNGLFALQLQDGVENTSVAQFELDYNLPINADGKLLLPVPAFKIKLNNDGTVEGCDVAWYLYNEGAQQYYPIRDFSTFTSMLHDINSASNWIGDSTNQEFRSTFSSDYRHLKFSKQDISWEVVNDLRVGIQYDVGNTHVRFQATKAGNP